MPGSDTSGTVGVAGGYLPAATRPGFGAEYDNGQKKRDTVSWR